MSKSTPRKSAASSTTKKDDATTEGATEGSTEGQNAVDEQGNPAGFSGPGTGVEAPPEQSARPPATMLDTGSTASGPLEPPGDAREQGKPEKGYNTSSTDHVYAAVGGRTIAGEDHVRLVDEDGNELGADDLFEEDPGKTWVLAKARVYEVFRYGNTTVDSQRLLFVPGQRIPIDQAEQIKAEVSDAPEPARSSEDADSASE